MSTTQPIRHRTVKRWGPEVCPVCWAKEGWDGVRITEFRALDDVLVPQITKRVCNCAQCGTRWVTTRG